MGAAATSLIGLGGSRAAGGEATSTAQQTESPETDGGLEKEIRTKTAKKESGDDAARAAHEYLPEKVEEAQTDEVRTTEEGEKREEVDRMELLTRKRSNKRAGRRAGKNMYKQAGNGAALGGKGRGKATSQTRGDEDEQSGSPPAPPNRYIFEGGLRRVAPYHFTYNTWVKERWRGREILAVFESEFRDRPLSYYRAALENGTVTVNDEAVRPDHVLQNGQRIQHRTHRHEPPVTADPVLVIHEDDDMLVINKPAGVPVHPAGRYQYNSVVEILKAERMARGDADFVPYPCNRLDRLTSGIMFLAKSRPAAKRLSLQIQARAVRKEYLARVVGRFPDGEVVCDMPILQISPKLGLNRVRASGRSARTVFKRLAYYGPGGEEQEKQEKQEKQKEQEPGQPEAASSHGPSPSGYSVVRCLPVTGRTHQIRVHLQYLGHPIENDPIYANQRVWGFNLGRGDADATLHTDDDIITRLSRMGKEDVADAVAYYDEMVDEYHKRAAEKMSGQQCPDCGTPLYTDPGAHELSLWLHSLRYEAADGTWSYVSPLPAWALPPDGASGPTEVGALDDLVGASDARGAILGEEEAEGKEKEKEEQAEKAKGEATEEAKEKKEEPMRESEENIQELPGVPA